LGYPEISLIRCVRTASRVVKPVGSVVTAFPMLKGPSQFLL
jgi:hypothetical protein